MSGDRVSSDYLPPSTWAPEPQYEAQRQQQQWQQPQQWHQQPRQQQQPPLPSNMPNRSALRQSSVGSVRRKPVPNRETALVLRGDTRSLPTMSPLSPPPPPLREVTEKVDTVSELEKKFKRISTHSTSLFRPPPPPAAPLRHHSDETHERRVPEARPRGLSNLKASAPLSMPSLSGPSSADVLDKIRRSVYMDTDSFDAHAESPAARSPPAPLRSSPSVSRRPISMAWAGASPGQYRVSSVPPASMLPSERPMRPVSSAHELYLPSERRVSQSRVERRQSKLGHAQTSPPPPPPPAAAAASAASAARSPPRRQARAPSLDSMSEEIWEDPDGIFGASAKSLSVAKMNESLEKQNIGASPNSKAGISKRGEFRSHVQKQFKPAELAVENFLLPGEELVNPGKFCSTAFDMHGANTSAPEWEEGFSFKPGGSELECLSCKLRIPGKSFRIEENSCRWEVSTRFIAKSHKAKEGAAGMATFGCVLCPQSTTTYRSRNELWAHLESHRGSDFEKDPDLSASQLSPVSRRANTPASQW